jgi:hypothetical protein
MLVPTLPATILPWPQEATPSLEHGIVSNLCSLLSKALGNCPLTGPSPRGHVPPIHHPHQLPKEGTPATGQQLGVIPPQTVVIWVLFMTIS